ncbi:MAG: hypothetical protein ACNA75_11990 [Thiohalomonadaceae bacterium]
MTSNSYAVVYTGISSQQVDRETVVGNLVLELKISEAKARALLDSPNRMLKRFDNPVDAQRLLDCLERAGVTASLQYPQVIADLGKKTEGESTLFRLLGGRPRRSGNQSVLKKASSK